MFEGLLTFWTDQEYCTTIASINPQKNILPNDCTHSVRESDSCQAAPLGAEMNMNNHVKVGPLNSRELKRERSVHDTAARITFCE